MADKNSPIGMFDSGVGGLSVLRVLKQVLPGENVIYYGDTAHLPYGEKTPRELAGYGRAIAAFLRSEGVKLVLIACNTATVYSLDAVREGMGDIPVLGIVEAGARAAAGKAESLGVIATRATIESRAYPNAVGKLVPGASVASLAAPKLVLLVEAGDIDSSRARRTVREELAPLAANPPSALILGCTHFPGLSPLIREVMPGTELIDPAYAMAEEAAEYLRKEHLLREEGDGSVRYYVSGDPAAFASSGRLILGEEIREVRRLPL